MATDFLNWNFIFRCSLPSHQQHPLFFFGGGGESYPSAYSRFIQPTGLWGKKKKKLVRNVQIYSLFSLFNGKSTSMGYLILKPFLNENRSSTNEPIAEETRKVGWLGFMAYQPL